MFLVRAVGVGGRGAGWEAAGFLPNNQGWFLMQQKSPPVSLKSSHNPVVQIIFQKEITSSHT